MHPKVASALAGRPESFQVHRHAAFPVPIASPQDFAKALGYPLHRITKSLLVRCTASRTLAMIVCPMGRRVDFGNVAARLGCKKVEVAPLGELLQSIGYPPNGVSPLGVGEMAVLMEESLMELPTVLIGAGEAGVEIEMAPDDLRNLTNAHVFQFAL